MSTTTTNCKNCNGPVSIIARKYLLVVEDEREIADWLKLLLKNEVEFRWVQSLNEALNEISVRIPDLIILDLKLPDGNGIDLLIKIREENLKIPVYVFSVNIELKSTCLRLGALDFFDKTSDNKLLVNKLEELL